MPGGGVWRLITIDQTVSRLSCYLGNGTKSLYKDTHWELFRGLHETETKLETSLTRNCATLNRRFANTSRGQYQATGGRGRRSRIPPGAGRRDRSIRMER